VRLSLQMPHWGAALPGRPSGSAGNVPQAPLIPAYNSVGNRKPARTFDPRSTRTGGRGMTGRKATLTGPARYPEEAGGVLAARTTHTTNTDVVVPVLGLVPVPVRGTQVPALVPVSATAQHARDAAFSDPSAIMMPNREYVANPRSGARCGPRIPERTAVATRRAARWLPPAATACAA